MGAILDTAMLDRAILRRIDLTGARLEGTSLKWATLENSIMSKADLTCAKLNGAHLDNSDLSGAILVGADLSSTTLFKADLSKTRMGSTKLIDINLSTAHGLETITHVMKSFIGIDTIYQSHSKMPEIFLRGAGIPEPFIASAKALVAAMEPIQFYSCFISYSSKDDEFAARLHADLQSKGVRCWFASEDLKVGDKLRSSFDEAIRLHDKLMVLLSEHSVNSVWVEKEVETAFEKERKQNRTVLFPIRLDDAVMETEQAWAADIRRTRHIGDFRNWKDHDSYKKAFERLLRDLQSETTVQSARQSR